MLTMTAEILVCVGMMAWLLSQKRGEKFSANFAMKLILAGMIPVVIPISLDSFRPAADGIPPLLYGFLMALFVAACVEELLIFIAFRVAIRGGVEVKSAHDAVLTACLVNMGFVLLDDILYTVVGASLLRAILLVHFIFGVAMGYFYAKAKATGKFKYHALSVCAPILGHTLLDIWPYAMRVTADMSEMRTYALIMMGVDALFAALLVVSIILLVRWGNNPKMVAAPGKDKAPESGAAVGQGARYANPESMDDYIRVTSPPVWFALASMLALALGVFAWATLGELRTDVQAGALAENGVVTCYVPLNYADYLTEESAITVSGRTTRYNGSPTRTVSADSAEGKLLRDYGIDPTNVAAVETPIPLDDGLYWATVQVETVSPIKLILG